MMRQLTISLLYLLMINIPAAAGQNAGRMADFQILQDTEYNVSVTYNFIANLTDQSVSTFERCAQKCLEYILCETATFYIQTQICSLYRERYGLGQLINVPAQTATMIILNHRQPPIIYDSSPSVYGDIVLRTNQFMYSPNQLYAFGLYNGDLGVYSAYTNGSIRSTSPQESGLLPSMACFTAQGDGDIKVYWSCGSSMFGALGTAGAGSGPPYILYLFNNGALRWFDSTNTTIWLN